MTPQQIDKIAWKIYSRPLKSGVGQILTREYRWHGKVDGKNILVIAPCHFIWDGASIPRFAWSFIGSPFTGKYQQAALVHDSLYVYKEYFVDTTWTECTRKFADNLFRTIMIRDGVDEDKANTMWHAVRIAGHHVWAT